MSLVTLGPVSQTAPLHTLKKETWERMWETLGTDEVRPLPAAMPQPPPHPWRLPFA